LKNHLKVGIRYARTVVPYPYNRRSIGRISLLSYSDFHFRIYLGMPDRVADDILDGCANLVDESRRDTRIQSPHADTAGAGLRFEIAIGCHFLHKISEINGLFP
jgi:hypothetical protein